MIYKLDRKKFGKRLRYIRHSYNLTQKQLSIRMCGSGKMQGTISKYEHAKNLLSIDILITLAHVFEISLDTLLGVV